MAKKSLGNIIGSWAFLIGVIIAIVIGIIAVVNPLGYDAALWAKVLVIIGLLVGLLNVTNKETNAFLISGIALIIAGFFGLAVMTTVIPVASTILAALLQIFVPATIIVAIRNVFGMAKN